MNQREARALARETIARLRELPMRNVPSMRSARRELSQRLRRESPAAVTVVAEALIASGFRWMGYEIIHSHKATFESLTVTDVEELGNRMTGWGEVDAFGGLVAGPAWLSGQISDLVVARWTRSRDRWWRRAALVATVSLNKKSGGGMGDARRTLDICARLADDHDDMVEKALSWALRMLVSWDPQCVDEFLRVHEGVLAVRVKSEVNNKLETGLKNPTKGERA